MNCRHCQAEVKLPFVDLGTAPPSNAYLTARQLLAAERWFPLRVLVCERCWLVQTEDFVGAAELFDADYAYFSSVSTTWLAHAERYVEDMVCGVPLTSESHVIEIACNDGYLLQYVLARGIPCTGIEPTASTAAAARAKGVDVIESFFDRDLASRLATQGKLADLLVANNVLAHVPNINDFVAGIATVLKPDGVATFEFPHLVRLIADTQFDTIYHEHFSYLSLTTVQRILAANGLAIFDVIELTTHGGSLRVFAQRVDTGQRPCRPRVDALLGDEAAAGVDTAAYYHGFQAKVELVKDDFLRFLLAAKRDGAVVAAYGAAAKGNTLINFAGIRADLIRFVVDRNPMKAGNFLPGSRIPIVEVSHLSAVRPDYIVILPWNLRNEVIDQLADVRKWNGRFLTAVPHLEVA